MAVMRERASFLSEGREGRMTNPPSSANRPALAEAGGASSPPPKTRLNIGGGRSVLQRTDWRGLRLCRVAVERGGEAGMVDDRKDGGQDASLADLLEQDAEGWPPEEVGAALPRSCGGAS